MRSVRGWIIAMNVVAVATAMTACSGSKSRLESHMRRGQEYYTAGDYAKAGVEFRNAMQIAPKDPQARLMAGHVAEKLGQMRNAWGLYQSVVDEAGDNVDARTALGRLLIVGGDPKRGMDAIAPALLKHPDDAALLALRAAAKSEQKDAAGARADADRALSIDPKNEDALELRAGFYRQDGDLPAAIKLVSEGIEKLPNSTGLRLVLVSLYQAANQPDKAEGQLQALVKLKPEQLGYRFQLARFYVQAKRLDDAQKALNDAVKALPDGNEPKLMLAEFLVQERGAAQGAAALRQFIAASPDNYDLRLGLGALLQRTGDTPQAIAAYQEIVQRAGTESKGLMARDRLAFIAMQQKREPDARQLIEAVLKASPRDNDALLLRAQLAMGHGDSTAAIADLRAVLRDQPRNAQVNKMLAQALMAHGDVALAEEPLRTAVEAAPADGTARQALAEVLIRLQHPDQAVAVLEDAVHRFPNNPDARDGLIRAYLAKRDLAAAAKVADEFQKLQPDSARPYYLGGLVARADGRLDDAQKSLEKALAIQPRGFDALSDLAHLQVQRGQAAQAVGRIQQLLAANPKDALIQNLLGEVQMQQKNFSAASAAFVQAAQLAPKWWVPLRNLGLAKLGAGDVPGAVSTYEEGVKLAPTEVYLLTDLGMLYQHQGRIDEAVTLYRNWMKQEPGSQVAANNLAMLLVTYRTDRPSLDEALKLVAPFPETNNGNLLDTAGWVHFKRQEYSEAMTALQRATDLAPDAREIRYHLGMAEMRAGKLERARTDLEAALNGSAKFTGADDARAALATLKAQAS